MGTVNDAKEILTTAGIAQAIVQGICLPFGFREVRDRRSLCPSEGKLAIGSSVVSLVVSVVVVVLMLPTAQRSLTNPGRVEPTLVFFWMLLLVFVGCAVAAIVLYRQAWDYYRKAKGPRP